MRNESQSLAELKESLGLNITLPNTCWLDGGTCPYGIPNGKFEDRPRGDCHMNVGGCSKLKSSDLRSWIEVVVHEEAAVFEKKITDEFHSKKEPLSDFLDNQANVLKENKSINSIDEKLICNVAGIFRDLAEEGGYDVFVMEVYD